MRNPLLAILGAGIVTQREVCPDLPPGASGLPMVTETPCAGSACRQCVDVCPTQAITLLPDDSGTAVALDRGRCIGCSECLRACPTGTLVADRSTRVAARTREELVLTQRPSLASRTVAPSPRRPLMPFHRSLQIREVSTGCNATDLEVAAATNPIFDVARFGVHFVASPRFADALVVTGPVGRAMQEPLRRCYDAMAEPRLVIAVGTCAVSGGLHRGGYADANGVAGLLPVAAYVPGCPPHPWSIIHGILLAMGRE
jgi:Ni,Fe-hydrogenase III small subunit/NAD-dependent dihydropyrimidine dehydrogenase PreA subunit